MKFVLMLCILLVTIPAFAGTFRDDFEDGNCAGWEIFPAIDDRFSMANGVIRLDNFNKPEFETDLYIMGANWRDYSFSTDIRVVQNDQSNNWSGGAIAARWGQFEGFDDYVLFAAIVNGWVARCNTTINGTIGTIWNQPLAIPQPQIGKWYRAEIRAIGSDISFYVDGKLQLKREDSNHPKGGVSLFAYRAIVEFDNVVIEGPDIPDAGPSGYSAILGGKLATTWGEIRRGK